MLLLVGINPDTIKLHEAVNPCNELSANDGNRCVVGVGCTGLSLHSFCCSVELCTFTKPRSSYRRKINIQSHLLCEIGHYGIDSSFTSDKKKNNLMGLVFFLFMLIRHENIKNITLMQCDGLSDCEQSDRLFLQYGFKKAGSLGKQIQIDQ